MPTDRPPHRGIEILLLDVGQGDGSLILPPEGEGDAILFDCKDPHVVRATLEQKGIERLAAVIISHLDLDHIAGIADVLLSFGERIDKVYISPDRPISGTDPGAKAAKEVVDTVVRGRAGKLWEVVPATRDLRAVAQGPDWSVQVLAPEHATASLMRARAGHWEEPNRASAVIRVQMGDHAVLIGGDAPLITWAEIPEQELRAAVFRVPHHGGSVDDGDTPDGWDVGRLYQEIAPGVAVVSVGSRNRWEHPVPEWVEPVSGGACRMMCTQVTSRCQPDAKSAAQDHRAALLALLGAGQFAEPLWRHYRDAERTTGKRNREIPCAGTVVVRLTPDHAPTVLPSPDRHGPVVDLWEHPLCRPPPQHSDAEYEPTIISEPRRS